jgi:arabinofuranosyltransferase
MCYKGVLKRTLSTISKRLVPRSAHAFGIVSIGACFVAWASLFIYKSSAVGIDGRRYFNLFDDALISMRYAWNLSHGFGLVWNPGEYVEGYTNLLMTLLMALPTLMFDKADAVLAVQILGIVFMLVNAYLIMLIADQLVLGQERYRRLFLSLAFLCALSYYPLVYWSLMGMETGLLAVLLSLSVLCALKYAREQRPVQGVLLSVSLGLAFLTRPDTLVFAVPAFVYVFFVVHRGSVRKPSLSFLLTMVGFYILIIAGHELFRWGYYGEWLPNTYTLKVSGIPLFVRIVNGIHFVVPFLKEVSVLLLVVGAGLVFAFRRDKLFLASLFFVLVCYQVWVGGDPFPDWRLLSPAMPIMLVLVVHEILTILRYVCDKEVVRAFFLRNPIVPWRYGLGSLACLMVLGVLWSTNSHYLPDIAMIKPQGYQKEGADMGPNIALTIEQLTTPDATVGVFGAGLTPYYTGRVAIDFLGKTDPRIARTDPDLSGAAAGNGGMIYGPGHNKYDLNYSLRELRPTYAQGFGWARENHLDWAQSEYVMVDYNGVRVEFLKSSRDVHWDQIEAAVEAGEATLGAPETIGLKDRRSQ